MAHRKRTLAVSLALLLTTGCASERQATPAVTVTVTSSGGSTAPPGASSSAVQPTAAPISGGPPVLTNAAWSAMPAPGMDCTGASPAGANEVAAVQTSGPFTFVDRVCVHAASRWPEMLYAYTGPSNSPVSLGALTTFQDAASAPTASVSGDAITVSALEVLSGEANCCPTGHLVKHYSYSKGVMTYTGGGLVTSPTVTGARSATADEVAAMTQATHLSPAFSAVASNQYALMHMAISLSDPTWAAGGVGGVGPYVTTVQAAKVLFHRQDSVWQLKGGPGDGPGLCTDAGAPAAVQRDFPRTCNVG